MKLRLAHALAWAVGSLAVATMPGCGNAGSPAKSPGDYSPQGVATAEAAPGAADYSFSDDALAAGGFGPQTVALSTGHRAPSRQSTANRPLVAAATAPKDERRRDTATDAHDVALLVYTAGINLAVFQVVEKMNVVETLARNAGGYLSKRADQQMTIRVPRAKFFDTLGAIEKLGDVLHRDIQAVDVTDEYVDTEARLKNAHSLRDRLEALLAQATVKDAVEIAKELAKVTEIIEQLAGRMNVLKNKISFATITVTFSARDNATVPDRSLLPFPWLQQMGLTPLLSVEQ